MRIILIRQILHYLQHSEINALSRKVNTCNACLFLFEIFKLMGDNKQSAEKWRAASGNRTCDLFITNEAHYHCAMAALNGSSNIYR